MLGSALSDEVPSSPVSCDSVLFCSPLSCSLLLTAVVFAFAPYFDANTHAPRLPPTFPLCVPVVAGIGVVCGVGVACGVGVICGGLWSRCGMWCVGGVGSV